MNDEVPGLGWLGTGRMGAALAGRLIDTGQRVTVWNRTPAKTGPLVARGARAVDRITDLGGCDIVFVTVSSPRDLEQVIAELLSAESRPGVIVDCQSAIGTGLRDEDFLSLYDQQARGAGLNPKAREE